MKKLCFIDLETTGLSPMKNGVISIGCIIAEEGTDEDGVKSINVIDKIEIQCRPQLRDDIHPKALEVNGYTETQILNFQPATDAYKELEEFLSRHVKKSDPKDKYHFIAYNAKFDEDFLRCWYKKLNQDYTYARWFWTPSICLMQLAGYFLRDDRPNMKNFKLQTVAEHLSIDFIHEDLHTALADCRLNVEIYKYILQNT